MFKSFLFIGGLVCSIGLGVNNVPVFNDLHYETNETIELKANPKLASYNDEEYKITLTADELNTYTFENFNQVICNNSFEFYITACNYGGLSYSQNIESGHDGVGDLQYAYIYLPLGNLESYFNYGFDEGFPFGDYQYKFALIGDSVQPFGESLTITFASSFYADIKTAIELDISANSESMPQASDLFGYITQGATQFASALGQAFTSITAMIWDSTNSAPTFLGMVLLLSIGAGLIYLAFNIIRGLVRRLRG